MCFIISPFVDLAIWASQVQSQLDTLHKSLLSPNLPYYVADKDLVDKSAIISHTPEQSALSMACKHVLMHLTYSNYHMCSHITHQDFWSYTSPFCAISFFPQFFLLRTAAPWPKAALHCSSLRRAGRATKVRPALPAQTQLRLKASAWCQLLH